MAKTIVFGNHSPLNIENAETVAAWDAHHDFGHYRLIAVQGTMYHVYSSANSGCTYNGRDPETVRTYLFGCRTKEELIAWLLQRIKQHDDYGDIPVAAYNELLTDLGYEGEPA